MTKYRTTELLQANGLFCQKTSFLSDGNIFFEFIDFFIFAYKGKFIILFSTKDFISQFIATEVLKVAFKDLHLSNVISSWDPFTKMIDIIIQ